MRIERKVVCLCAVTFEEPRQGLPRVHDFKVSCIVDEFLVFVRRRCRRGYELIGHAAKFIEECLIGLAAKRTQYCRLVKARPRECVGTDVPVADPLVVRDKKPSGRGGDFLHAAHVNRCVHVKDVFGVAHELLLYAQRADDQHLAALVFVDEAAPFELHDGFP